MADKGFTIGGELKELGLSLNIPPFSASGSQMSAGDCYQTQKIAYRTTYSKSQNISNIVKYNSNLFISKY